MVLFLLKTNRLNFELLLILDEVVIVAKKSLLNVLVQKAFKIHLNKK